MKINEVRSDGSRRVALRFDNSEQSLSRTKQQFKDECDINLILKKYKKTGSIKTLGLSPIYGDFSAGMDFSDSMNRVVKAREVFDRLPSDVKRELDFDPSKMIDFALDDKNYDRAVALGLRDKSDAIENERKAIQDTQAKAKDDAARAEFVKKVKEAMASA